MCIHIRCVSGYVHLYLTSSEELRVITLTTESTQLRKFVNLDRKCIREKSTLGHRNRLKTIPKAIET